MQYRSVIHFVFYAVILMILQIFLFNYVHIGASLNAYVFILLILFLPFDIPKIWLLLIGFSYGLIFDIFNNSIAVNAAAMTTIAYIRPYLLRIMQPINGYEKGSMPSIYKMGFRWFAIYSLILIFIHQLEIFTLDIFSFHKVGVILLKSIINTVYSAIYILILNALVFKNRTK